MHGDIEIHPPKKIVSASDFKVSRLTRKVEQVHHQGQELRCAEQEDDE